jgi:predicted transcriptional regulator
MPIEDATLLSVRPRFATALLDGTKTVEIRRRPVRISEGSLLLLYASSPVRALVGAARVQLVDADTADRLWIRWSTQLGLHRDEYDAYLDGAALPCAIVLSAAGRLVEPIPLHELRRRRADFVTPQSYRSMSAEELSSLTDRRSSQLVAIR